MARWASSYFRGWGHLFFFKHETNTNDIVGRGGKGTCWLKKTAPGEAPHARMWGCMASIPSGANATFGNV
ncbi:hypothetical protein B0T18DRAFT_406993 [Schizothecium vesticola]|uniref:Uncharacterized protein n=1 Tax=Schizothecium vesticola TaxID=314040 RepID=A0AA40F212_9PEZI|nr:hypothetical protein B0T18DRAFT_406993 [Schizothecium vesticola]